MGVLADWQIENEGIVKPFLNEQLAKGILTYGVSSYGYDVRVADTFQVFCPELAAAIAEETKQPVIIDPKNFDKRILREVKGEYCIIPPNAFALAFTLEEITVPRSCIAIVLGKSSYARCALVVNVTPLEPLWRGRITIELSNTSPLPLKVYSNEGIAQVLFLRADGLTQLALRPSMVTSHDLTQVMCRQSYADKKGRYQDQGATVTLPCVRGQDVRTTEKAGTTNPTDSP